MLRTLYRLRRRRRYALLEELLRNAELSAEALAEEADRALRMTLTAAVEHVPAYRGLRRDFDEALNERVPAAELLALFPVVGKRELQGEEARYVSGEAARIPHRVASTGGSTGEPLRFLQDVEYKMLGQAALLRCFAMMGCRPEDDVVWVWGEKRRSPLVENLRAVLRPLASGKRLVNALQMTEADFPRLLKTLRDKRVRFIYGYPSSLYFIACWMERTGAAAPPLDGIMTSAERLDPLQRETIARVFAAPVFDQYGSREVAGVACECARGAMHVFTDLVRLEVPEPREDGAGPLVVTNLHNRSMPLVRYALGDEGALLSERCECGLPFPLMRVTAGRTYDNFIMPSGAVVFAGYFTRQLYGVAGIERFQFVQKRRDRIELRIVRDPEQFGEKSRRVVGDLEERVRRELKEPLRVETQYVDAIPLSPLGKHRFAYSELHGAASERLGAQGGEAPAGE